MIRHRHKQAGKAVDPTAGVPNRPWGHHPDLFCGEQFGAAPCDRPEKNRGTGVETGLVAIAGFVYYPGDFSLPGSQGAPVRIKKGSSLTFLNVDQAAGIRHSVTTCKWPCNGRYVGNYPFPDGVWDSKTLGYDLIDGGTAIRSRPHPRASRQASTPTSAGSIPGCEGRSKSVNEVGVASSVISSGLPFSPRMMQCWAWSSSSPSATLSSAA